MLNRCWKPVVSYVGIDGVPDTANAGNVLRPYTKMKISVRAPPTLDVKEAGEKLKAILEANPPAGAKVECTIK